MTPAEIKDIVNKFDWEKRWMERFSWFTPSLVGNVYMIGCKQTLGVGLTRNIFVYRDGLVTCYQSVKENAEFGNYLARQLENKPELLDTWDIEVRNTLKNAVDFTSSIGTDILTKEYYQKFEDVFAVMQPPFVRLTRVCSYIRDEYKDRFLPTLNALRLETETIYGTIDARYQEALKVLAKKINRDFSLLSGLHFAELRQHFLGSELPTDDILRLRVPYAGLIFLGDNEYGEFLNAEDTTLFEKYIVEKNAPKDGSLKGMCAMPGVVRGTVRIVLDPRNPGLFNNGDILVTSMTYPEFVPLMKKAGAIVTDGGGVLCHAAIVARELKKPCIINTQVATAILMDGDMVEVDATSGVIKKV